MILSKTGCSPAGQYSRPFNLKPLVLGNYVDILLNVYFAPIIQTVMISTSIYFGNIS